MLFGVIAGILYYPFLIIAVIIYPRNPVIAIILPCAVPISAGFITGRIGRRRTGTITGIISVVVFATIGLLISRVISASTLVVLVIFGLIVTFLSFIGACLGTIGRGRRLMR